MPTNAYMLTNAFKCTVRYSEILSSLSHLAFPQALRPAGWGRSCLQNPPQGGVLLGGILQHLVVLADDVLHLRQIVTELLLIQQHDLLLLLQLVHSTLHRNTVLSTQPCSKHTILSTQPCTETVLSTQLCTETQSWPLDPAQKHNPVHSTLHKNTVLSTQPCTKTVLSTWPCSETVLSTQSCTKTQSCPLNPAQKHSPVHPTMHKNTVLSTRPCTKTQSYPFDPAQKHSPVHSTMHKNTVLSTWPGTKTVLSTHPCAETQSRRVPTPLSSTVHKLSRPSFFLFLLAAFPSWTVYTAVPTCLLTMLEKFEKYVEILQNFLSTWHVRIAEGSGLQLPPFFHWHA